MSLLPESLTFHFEPVWPWSLSLGLPALAIVALALVILTRWTYNGVGGASRSRVTLLITLRLTALILACLVLLRPSLASRDDLQFPSTLLFLIDSSESMTIQDEADGKSRWDYLQRVLTSAEPHLRNLREEHNVTIMIYRFADDLGVYAPNGKADGKRTDFGQALQALFGQHGRERTLRGLFVFSDGADNGTRFPPDQPLAEAGRWRSVPCPIHTFGLGKPTTAERERDVAFTEITPAPSPVAVKGKLTVKGFVDAPGFENAQVVVRLLVDDKEVRAEKETLRKTLKNEVSIETDAPFERPKNGEIKVTLRVDPVDGELTSTNNEISTYVSVTKEGISVLLVDQPRHPEPQLICDALAGDPRIRVFPAWLRSDESKADSSDLFQFDKQQYDVIILGDLSARRLRAADPKAIEKIHELVRDKGAGLMMMGGWNAFGGGGEFAEAGSAGDWKGTPLESLSPVSLDVRGEFKGLVKLQPTPAGIGRFLMRLSDNPVDNKAIWQKLPELNGMSNLGKEKGGALVLAVRADTDQPVLVSQDFGKGRTLAFAGDTTWRWQRLGQPKTSEGIELHARFWRQAVLWLAKQDETEGNVWIRPEKRRIDAGEKLGFTVGLRGKGGVEVPDAKFVVTVIDPKGIESPLITARDDKGVRGTYWKSDQAGEHYLVVRGHGKDTDGKTIPEATASARFIVSQNNVEMTRRAADHAYLARLAQAGGGKLHKIEELNGILKELPRTVLAQSKPKSESWPDWRTTNLHGFRVGIFLAFASVLCIEWFLRRYWGLV